MKVIRRAVAALIVLGGCGLVLTPALSGATARALRQQPGSVSECGARHLVGLTLGGGAAAGNLSTIVGLVNVGTAPCRLGGYPALEGTRTGRSFPLVVSGHGTFFGDLQPAVLAPRVLGALIVGTEDGCYAINQPNPVARQAEVTSHSYTGLRIVLPLHGGVVTVGNVRFDTACVLQSSRLGWRSDLLRR